MTRQGETTGFVPPAASDEGRDFAVSDEMQAAWAAYEPIGQFNETMSFARFNGMMRHAFLSGMKAASPEQPASEAVGAFDLTPDLGADSPEPSLRTIVEQYYGAHFPPDQAQNYTDAYFAALAERGVSR